jgi:1,6-anhydro-N-acetylmuramate kinase
MRKRCATCLPSPAHPAQVAAIGCHGQTIRHQPAAGYSVAAEQSGATGRTDRDYVVADFRSRDIAAGGQGAPLVPAFHAAVFGDPGEHRVILNVGGIANLTDLKPGPTVRGFDCGPGNLLMDAWIERHKGLRYDEADVGQAGGRCFRNCCSACWPMPFSPPAAEKLRPRRIQQWHGWRNIYGTSARGRPGDPARTDRNIASQLGGGLCGVQPAVQEH